MTGATDSNAQLARQPHQLTALNNYLLHIQNAGLRDSLPPFSTVIHSGSLLPVISAALQNNPGSISHRGFTSQILFPGTGSYDESAFIEVARASLNGVDLPEAVQDFVQGLAAREGSRGGQASQVQGRCC